MTALRSLFAGTKSQKLLHPSFRVLAGSAWNVSTRRLMNDAFSRLVERDGNFVEQFQTTGFNSRTFELYVSELLSSEGFANVGDEPQPDFTVVKNDVQISIECTTVNPTGNDAAIKAYESFGSHDPDVSEIKARQHNQLPIRFAGVLRSKMNHRLERKKGGKAYWELPHVEGRPFVIAVQTFHEHGSLTFSNVGVIRYLYGLEHRHSWDEDGRLLIATDRVEQHRHGDKEIPSGFFDFEGSENISAVLWTNAGTVAKFTRMALAGPYPDPDVSMVRFGNRFDSDPDAHLPLPFAHIVGDRDAPSETWGLEANLFHNPRAKHPVPLGLFETVTDSTFVDGVYIDRPKSDFIPVMSISNSIRGNGHRRNAEVLRDRILEEGARAYAERMNSDAR